MAAPRTSATILTEQLQQVGSVLGAFGLGSIVVVVIGRLWTLSYFRYFGLSTGDLEFGIEDFAFRSLEVWISLGLAGFGLALALRLRTLLEKFGTQVLLVELGGAALASWFMLWALEPIVRTMPLLASTGGLGVIGGFVLIGMIFLVADVWYGPGEDERSRREVAQRRRVGVAWRLARKWCRRRPVWKRAAALLRLLAAAWSLLAATGHKLIAAVLAVAIVVIYLPRATDTLAVIQATVDLEEGRLPVAILETVEDPLPIAIASDADATKSNLVRVVLAQGENTYVLHSTQCKTIGEPDVEVEETEEGFTFTRDLDVCKVFAIPTKRLKSIEYRSVTGSPPPNDTPFLAAQVGLRQPFAPFEATVSTRGAGDDEHIRCQDQEPLRHTVWYEVMPNNEGALLVRVDSLTEDLSPVIGVWPGSDEAVLEQDAASGSGPRRRACETRTVEMPRERQRALPAPDNARRVATIANLQAERTYFVGIGANESVQGRTEGDFHIFIQFFPDGAFLAAKQEGDLPPTIELPSTLGRVELELRRFDREAYTLRPLEVSPAGFSLTSEEGGEVPFKLVADSGEADRTTLAAQGLLQPGTWRLTSGGQPPHLASLVIPTLQPNLILALEGTPDDPQKLRALRALAAVLHPTQLQLEGSVVFVQGLDPTALEPTKDEEAVPLAKQWLDASDLLKTLSVEVNAVEQGEETVEEQLLLGNAVTVVQEQLEDLGATVTANVTVGQCQQICIRIFLIRLQPEVPAESEVLGEPPQPEGPEPEQ